MFDQVSCSKATTSGCKKQSNGERVKGNFPISRRLKYYKLLYLDLDTQA